MSIETTDIDEQAASWLVRRDLRALSPEEQAQLDQWLRDPLHAARYREAQRTLQGLAAAADDPLMRALRDEALAQSAPTPAARTPAWRRPAAIAAGLVLLAGGAVTLALLRTGTLPPQQTAHGTARAPTSVLPVERYATARGERRELTLADGSRLTLDTDTSLEVELGLQQRVVRLQRGQAIFDVAKDAARPFLVESGARTVRAVGTLFDVYAGEREWRVLLAEGAVVVAQTGAAELHLLPGQGVFATGTQAGQLRQVDARRAMRWREGFIEFDDQPLVEAVEAMNRYSPTPVTLDEHSAGLRISGVFRTDGMAQFLEVVADLLPVRVRAVAGGPTEITAR